MRKVPPYNSVFAVFIDNERPVAQLFTACDPRLFCHIEAKRSIKRIFRHPCKQGASLYRGEFFIRPLSREIP